MIRHLLLLLSCLLCLAPVAFATETANPRTMQFKPLTYSIPKAERVLLNNGMPVYLLQDKELPIISISAMIRTGSVYEPADKAGLAGLTGSLLRGGGTAQLSPAALDDELEFMASAVESSFGTEQGTVSMTSLTRNLPRTLQLFADVLRTPHFDQQRFEIARKQALEALRRQNDDPKELGDRELHKAIYAGHPLGRFPTAATLAAISRDDLLKFHQQFVQPANILLAISGDFDRTTLLAALNKTLGSMKNNGTAAMPVIPPVPAHDAPETLLVEKQINQSVIRLGHLGISKDSPDLYALRVLDYILGGSFTSRLMMEIRTNQGLAYNVGSHFDIGRLFTGSFTAETETRADATLKTVGLMTSIIDGIRKEPVSEQELKLAKESIINSFLFGFTTASSVVTQQARLEFYGYAPDYLDKYRERIASVTREEVLQAARKHLRPNAFKLLVVGDPKRFDKPLDALGKVTTLKLD